MCCALDIRNQKLTFSSQVPRLRPPRPEEATDHSRLLQMRERLRDWRDMLPHGLLMTGPERATGSSNNGTSAHKPVKEQKTVNSRNSTSSPVLLRLYGSSIPGSDEPCHKRSEE